MSSAKSDAARVLGARIRDERQRFAVSQMELAELAGLHFTNLGRIERGQANATLDTLLRIAAALNLELSTLVHGLTADMLEERPRRRVTVRDLIQARQAEEAQVRDGGR